MAILYTKDMLVIANLWDAVARIRTVKDLSEYLRTCPFPVMASCIQPAIPFFSKDLHKENGKLDWEAVKERRRLELNFRLTPEHDLTPEILDALRWWMVSVGYGRDLGTGFTDNLLSSNEGAPRPRDLAFDFLQILREEIVNAGSAKGLAP